ncbi:MAG: MBOAT family O-acyltransferase [Bacteroidota bacterium]|nr:MBOAT family O-acyltransferase [Bacteroidota bacterium]
MGKKFKNAVLLLSSILFYMWGAPLFIFAILATTTLDFYLVKIMNDATSERKRKMFLVLSLCLNLGMLFYFKYCNFFVENFNMALSGLGMKQVQWTQVVLPIGISFYTFESLTYVVDVYRRLHKPLKNFWQYQTYILLFPKLIAGPIIRYHEIGDQLTDRSENETLNNKISGMCRFIIGLSKKVLIANIMAEKADILFAIPENELIPSGVAWLGMLAYTFQIYFDFSGYSDMAIGIGRMLGFKFPENFNNPYLAGSITEFWRRWHMTLGNWMRNYLYIPLGGNKVNSRMRLYFNLWIVFLASGFWHGAAWTFIFWGAYHGLFLVLERIFLLKVYEKIGRFVSTIITFFLVAVGWIFFRSDTVTQGFAVIQSMFSFTGECPPLFIEPQFIALLGLAFFFSFFALSEKTRSLQNIIYFSDYTTKQTLVFTGVAACLYILSLASILSTDFNPFIYFRF